MNHKQKRNLKINLGDREEVRLGEVSKRINDKNKNNEKFRHLTISAQLGLIDQEDYFDRQIGSKDSSNYYIIKNGEFAYNKSYSNGYPYGAIKRLDNYEKGILSPLYICFNMKNKKVDTKYIQLFFESSKWYKYIDSISTEGARNHGILNVGTQDFFDMPILLPNITKQNKIADFLSSIDILIEKQEENIELIKRKKQGYSKIIFDSNLGDRKEVRLGDVATFKKGKGISKNDITEDGKKECIRYADLFTEYKQKIINIKTKTNYSSNPVLSKGNEVLMPTSDVTPTGLSTASALSLPGIIIGGDILIISSKVLANVYLAYLITYDVKQILQLVSGTTVYHIYEKDMSKFKFNLPSLEKQNKISNLLSSMDNLIELNQEKLEQLKLKKKYYLNEIFG